MSGLTAFSGLFLSAFVAASLFPAQSELVLVGMLRAQSGPVWALVLCASLGNVLGSLLNYVIGRHVERFRDRRWFPVGARGLARAQGWYGTYGRWSLLLSWLPVVGDPLTLVAGIMREPVWRFLLLVSIAKTGRYVVLALGVLGMW